MRVFRRHSIALACSACLLSGCASFERAPVPGETAGSIYVSSPRVSGRERLVNDRREQEEWLQRQLAAVDQAQFGVNGAMDTRSFSAIAAGLVAKTGPDVDLQRAEQLTSLALTKEQGASVLAAERVRSAAVNQIASQLSKKEIDAKEAAAQLNALGISTVPLSTSSAASAPSATASGAGSAALSGSVPFIDTFKGTGGAGFAPGSGASGAAATMTGSPVDLFRDRLALREEIRNEINENALDETHDLANHTLYRLTFDATLVPDDDTSAWGIVSVVMRPVVGSDKLLWADYRVHKERQLNALILDRIQKIQPSIEQCRDQAALPTFIRCVAERTFAPGVRQRLVAAASQRADIARLWTLMGGERVFVQQSIVEALGAFRATSTSPSRTETKPVRSAPAPTAPPAPAAAASGAAMPSPPPSPPPPPPLPAPSPPAVPLPPDAAPPRLADQFAGALFGVVAEATASEFDDEQLGCFYQVVTDKGAPRPFTNYQNANEFVLRLRAPPADKVAGSCDLVTPVDEAFAARVDAIPVQARAYAVTPKEAVQRISDVSSRRAASEFMLGLSALAGVGKFDAMAASVRQNDVFLQALRRQPLVVGFAEGGSPVATTDSKYAKDAVCACEGEATKEAKFGWVLGPTFAISADGSRATFRHTVRQQSVTASVVVPSWWRAVDVEIKTAWLRENRNLRNLWNEGGDKLVFSTRKYKVGLPFRPSALDGVFVASLEDRQPYVEDLYNAHIQVGTAARLLIRGGNIWRSTEVFIGAQRADRVRLLPDMKGLVAEFDEIRPVWGSDLRRSQDSVVDISIATADGFTSIGVATVKKGTSGSPAFVGIGRRFFGDKTVALRADPPLRSFRAVELRAKSRINAVLDVKLGDTGGGQLAVARDGTSVQVTPKIDDLKLKAGDPVDLIFVTTSDDLPGPLATPIVQNAVYYPKTVDAQAILSWHPATGTGLRAIKVKLPPGAQKAFQGLATATTRLLISLKTSTGETATLDPITCKTDGSDCVVKPTIANPTKEVAAALASGDFTLEVKFEADDAPEFSPSTLAGK